MPLPAIPVTSAGDERLAAYRQLNDPARRRLVEGAQGIFAVEGRLALVQLLASPYPVVSVLLEDTRVVGLADLLRHEPAPVYSAPRRVLAETVGFDLHRGVVAIARRLPEAEPLAVAATRRPVLVLEGVNDHENLGALFRNGRALGAGAVLMDPTTADPLYRRSVRVSLGHVLRVPFARLAPWPAALAELRAGGRTIVALTPDPAADAVDGLAGLLGEHPAPVALLLGAEGPGLSAPARRAADIVVRIPMADEVDSLNVATAAAIALHRLPRPAPA